MLRQDFIIRWHDAALEREDAEALHAIARAVAEGALEHAKLFQLSALIVEER